MFILIKMQYSDGSSVVELRLKRGDVDVSTKDIFVDATDNSLVIKVQHSGFLQTLINTSCLYERIKPGETIWYMHYAL